MENTATPDQSVATLAPQNEIIEGSNPEDANEMVTRYVVVEINNNNYGMPTASTVELMSSDMTQVTRVPQSPDFISGVINHRGTIIPVIDMRSLLGFDPRSEEANKLSVTFQELKDDHVNWLAALQDSVYQNTEFHKATDPTQCSFGKWYQTILDGSSSMSRFSAEDPILKSLIERFDVPHRKIHALAEEVLKLKNNGETDKAIAMINKTRETSLVQMCELFNQILAAVASKLDSMLVITEVGARKAAIAVDAVSFVVDCKDDSVEALPDTADNIEFLSGLVHQADGSYILIADLVHVYNTACPAA